MLPRARRALPATLAAGWPGFASTRGRIVTPVNRPTLQRALTATLREAGCVFADDEATLLLAEVSDPSALQHMVARRVAGTPLEHVVGWAEFCGLRIAVDTGVFVPRRRTQFMVRLATDVTRPGDTLVDLCCGTGAIGVATAAAIGPVDLHAVDIDDAAVACARRNVKRGSVYRGDLFSPLPHALRGRVNVIAANVPYVPTAEIALLPPEARDHEPTLTLDGGADGLLLVRRVVAEAPRWLAPGGHLLLEVGEHQARDAAQALTARGLATAVHRCEDLDATVVVGVGSVVDGERMRAGSDVSR